MSSTQIIVYGTPACPMVRPVRAILDKAAVPYTYIDITKDETSRHRVKAINNGYESVPTLVFPDNTTLTEPNPQALQQKLATMGYQIDSRTLWLGYLLNNPSYWLLFLGILLALLRVLGVF